MLIIHASCLFRFKIKCVILIIKDYEKTFHLKPFPFHITSDTNFKITIQVHEVYVKTLFFCIYDEIVNLVAKNILQLKI